MGVPYTFGTATTSIPLSQLDANFNTPVTLGNTTVGLGNTVTTVGNLTLTNVNITSGTINSAVVVESYALANAVVYSDASKDGTTSANLTFNGTTFTAVNDASISGLTVGKGGGADQYNTAIGLGVLGANTTGGSQNVGVGWNALQNNTTGTNNVAVGMQSLKANTTASDNSALGLRALQANTTGANNVAVGKDSLYSNTTASNNTAVGYQAGYSNTTGTANAVFGYQAAYTNSTGTGLVAIGRLAGYTYNTNGTDIYGSTFVGTSSGYATTSGIMNSALGGGSLQNNTTGGYNTALGAASLYSNTTASNNTAVGYQAGYSGTTSSENTYLGYQTGYSTTTAARNVFVGFQTGYSNTTGQANVFMGGGQSGVDVGAGYAVTTGSNNTFIGWKSGNKITTGGKNSILGAYDGNQDGLDIRTASNYAVISDGDGNRLLSTYNGGTLALDGGAVPQAGTGITFPATQSASSDANTLDDYEEGTFTPTVTASTSNPTVGYAAQSGFYTKIGRTVNIQGRMQLNSISGGSGNFRLSGLPFANNGGLTGAGTSWFSFLNLDAGYTMASLYLENGNNFCSLAQSGDNVSANQMTIGAIGSSFDITFSFTYIT